MVGYLWAIDGGVAHYDHAGWRAFHNELVER